MLPNLKQNVIAKIITFQWLIHVPRVIQPVANTGAKGIKRACHFEKNLRVRAELGALLIYHCS